MATSRSFHDLTEAGRARRLRGLAIRALDDYDLDVRGVRLLSASQNAIYRVDTDGEPLVIRVSQPDVDRGPDAIAAEVDVIEGVSSHTDLSVPKPIRNRRGELVTRASAPGVPEPRSCTVFTWVRGVELAERITPVNWTRLGELTARLHDFGESWTPPESAKHLLRFDRTFHYDQPVCLFEHDDPVVKTHRSLFREAHEAVDAFIARVVDRAPLIVTHGDLHPWNVLCYRTTLSPVDFEDAQWSTPLFDVSTSHYYIEDTPAASDLMAAFRSGYTRTRPWVEAAPNEVEALYVARSLDLLNMVLGSDELDVPDWERFIDRVERMARRSLAHLGSF